MFIFAYVLFAFSSCDDGTDAGEDTADAEWLRVADTSIAAAPNMGYIADNPSRVTITLPGSCAYGDTVRVTGAGGWKIAQNAGQVIMTRDVMGPSGKLWVPHGTSRNWRSVASSADGTRLVAVTYNGQIYTSRPVAAQTKARVILAANLKRLRNSAGITQEVLAERAGCSPTMIGNLEIGKRFPSAELLY